MRTVTLAQLRTRALRLADLENASSWVSNAEVDDYINEAVAKWWDIISSSQAQEWFKEWFISQTEPDVDTYPLDPAPQGFDVSDSNTRFTTSSAFYKLLGVDVIYGDFDRLPSGNPRLVRSASGYLTIPRSMRVVALTPFMNNERNFPRELRDQYLSNDVTWAHVTPMYRVGGDVYLGNAGAFSEPGNTSFNRKPNITFVPAPESRYWYRVWYLPYAPKLVDDADEITTINGWEEYVVADVAQKLLTKEESDPSAVMAIKQSIEASIRDSSSEQDASSNDVIQDWYRRRVHDATTRGAGTRWCAASTFLANEADVVSIAVTPDPASVPNSSTQQFTATATYTNGTTADVSAAPNLQWSVDDTAIATIDGSGLLTPLPGPGGTVTVQATYSEVTSCSDYVAWCSQSPETFSASPAATQQQTLTVMLAYSGLLDATALATWSSDDPSVATVSSSGLITAVSVGSTTIRATYLDMVCTVPVNVTEPS